MNHSRECCSVCVEALQDIDKGLQNLHMLGEKRQALIKRINELKVAIANHPSLTN